MSLIYSNCRQGFSIAWSKLRRLTSIADHGASTGATFQAILGRPLTWLAGSAAALSLVIFVGWSLVRRAPLKVEIAPEPLRESARIVPAPAGSGSASPVVVDPCVNHVRATGAQPLIDDFEDGNPLIGSFENRVGLWGLYKDTDPLGANMPLTPTLRPQPTPGNRFALHAVGGEFRDWGAIVQFDFQPSCYDASVYGGIAFSAKGPGRVYVGIQEVRVVPVQWGELVRTIATILTRRRSILVHVGKLLRSIGLNFASVAMTHRRSTPGAFTASVF